MNYDDFIEYIKENLGECYKEIMFAEYSNKNMKNFDKNKLDNIEVSLQKVVKNNG